jgi:medium-chain acyl-[acyl-carrier-protein] hydrolase
MTTGAGGAVALARFPGAAPPTRRLFCFPYAGGGTAVYRPWRKILPSDVEIAAVQFPGRESRIREAPLRSIAEMARGAVDVILANSDVPFALFGHSMGALVAYEAARSLESLGAPGPSHLFVSARRPPHVDDHLPPVHHLPDDAFVEEMNQRYQAIPDVVRNEPELMELLLPVLRADIEALEKYGHVPGPRLRCSVQVYGGSRDFHPFPDQLTEWQAVAEQPISVKLFDGDHFFLTSQVGPVTSDLIARWMQPALR